VLAYIKSGSIGIVKSSQQLTVNSQQLTIIPVQPELILFLSNLGTHQQSVTSLELMTDR